MTTPPPPLSAADQLRNLLGEPVPEGGDESDTLFSAEVIQDLLARHVSPAAACLEGWKIKAAALADLVDIADGDSKRSMSQAHAASLRMIKMLADANPTASPGTTFRKINRGGFAG